MYDPDIFAWVSWSVAAQLLEWRGGTYIQTDSVLKIKKHYPVLSPQWCGWTAPSKYTCAFFERVNNKADLSTAPVQPNSSSAVNRSAIEERDAGTEEYQAVCQSAITWVRGCWGCQWTRSGSGPRTIKRRREGRQSYSFAICTISNCQ